MEKYEIIIRGLILLYLVIASSEDLKRKRISLCSLILFVILGIIPVWYGRLEPFHLSRILGMIPGTVLAIVSKISGESIGMGDAVIIAWLGYMLGVFELLVILSLAGVICFVAAGVMYFRKKRGEIPFVPFLCVGYYLNLWSLVMQM